MICIQKPNHKLLSPWPNAEYNIEVELNLVFNGGNQRAIFVYWLYKIILTERHRVRYVQSAVL